MITEAIWTLKESLDLIRTLQLGTRTFGYHVCLGGGVLNRGSSKKDLDLYFLPLDRKDNLPRPKHLLTWLEEMWGQGEDLTRKLIEPQIVQDRNTGIRSYKETERVEYPSTPSSPYVVKRKYLWSGMRIDIFILDTRPVEGVDKVPKAKKVKEAQSDSPTIDPAVATASP